MYHKKLYETISGEQLQTQLWFFQTKLYDWEQSQVRLEISRRQVSLISHNPLADIGRHTISTATDMWSMKQKSWPQSPDQIDLKKAVGEIVEGSRDSPAYFA